MKTKTAKTAKTGLAKRMRAWMKTARKPFSPKHVCDGLGIDDVSERDRVRCSVSNFVKRGEITRASCGGYIYNHDWKHGRKSPLKAIVLKTIHVFNKPFTASDIKAYCDAPTVNYVQKIILKLLRGGYVKQAGRRQCKGGMELLYSVSSPSRYRTEVLK